MFLCATIILEAGALALLVLATVQMANVQQFVPVLDLALLRAPLLLRVPYQLLIPAQQPVEFVFPKHNVIQQMGLAIAKAHQIAAALILVPSLVLQKQQRVKIVIILILPLAQLS